MTLAPLRVLSVLLVGLAIALPAHAQDERKAEISVGYQLLTLNEDDVDETFGRGWYADVAGNIGPIFAVVLQVGGSYKTVEETETVGGVTATATAKLKVHNYLGGIRVGPRRARVSPYAEFLAGGVTASADVSASVVGGGQTLFSTDESESSSEFAIQFGGGVTIWLSDRVGVRGSIGYLRVMAEDAGTNVLRATGGVSFGF